MHTGHDPLMILMACLIMTILALICVGVINWYLRDMPAWFDGSYQNTYSWTAVSTVRKITRMGYETQAISNGGFGITLGCTIEGCEPRVVTQVDADRVTHALSPLKRRGWQIDGPRQWSASPDMIIMVVNPPASPPATNPPS